MQIQTTPSHVTVYRSGAHIVRKGVVAAGQAEVTVDDLPIDVDDASIVARFESTGPVVTQVRVTASLTVPPAEPTAVDSARANFDQAKRAKDLCAQRLYRLKDAFSRIDLLFTEIWPTADLGDAPAQVALEGRVQGLQCVRSEKDRLDADWLAARTEFIDLEQKQREAAAILQGAIERHSSLLARVQAHRHRFSLRKILVLSLHWPDGVTDSAPLSLEYRVSKASWKPAYRLVLPDDSTSSSKGAQLTLLAQIQQSTGEDWSNVRVVLSTALPTAWCDLPKLKSLRFGRRQPAPNPSGYRDPPRDTGELFANYLAFFGQAKTQFRELPVPPPATEPVPRGYGAPPAPLPPAAPALAAGPITQQGGDLAESDSDLAFGGAMPSPMQAPAPIAAPAPQAAKRARMAMPPPARSMPSFGVPSGPPGASAIQSLGAAPTPPPPDSFALDLSLLSFAHLRLHAPWHPQRGTLAPIDRACQIVDDPQTEEGQAVIAFVKHRDRSTEREFAPLSDDGFDYAYAIDGEVTVPSASTPKSILAHVFLVDATLTHVSVPRIKPEAYRQLRVANPLDAPMLRGPLDVYRGSDYLLTTQLKTTPAGGEIHIGLGVESAIRIARNSFYKESATGLLGGGLSLDHEVTTEIRSLLAGPATIEVRDVLPSTTPTEKDIKVDVTYESPKSSPWLDDGALQAGVRWQLTLAPNKVQSIALKYSVRIAGKHELVGGNRREP